MRLRSPVFADTCYWIALAMPRDKWRDAAREAQARLGGARLVTTEEVLSEFLTAVSKEGPLLRRRAVEMVRRILASPNVRVLPQSHDSFLRGLDLYARRLDKGYSLVDCISMNAMRDEGLVEALTNDRHFGQEGFEVLIREFGPAPRGR